MSITVPAAVSGFPPGSDRLVSTRINGVTVALPCFDWCTASHHGEDTRFVEDFNHTGEPVEVTTPAGDLIFSAQLTSYPHCGTGTKLGVDYDGYSDELDAAQAEQLADRLIAVASRIRHMATQLPKEVA